MANRGVNGSVEGGKVVIDFLLGTCFGFIVGINFAVAIKAIFDEDEPEFYD